MHRFLRRMLLTVPLCWMAASGAAQAAGVVLVAEDGGFDASTVQTVRTIASTELRVRGVELTDDPRYHATVPLTPEILQGVATLGAERLFVVRLGRLGTKVMISIEELRAPDATPLFAATLAAENIEEADTVVPRLVRAVLDRVPPGATAGIATVTAQESKAFRKKPGEGMLILGLGVAPLGGSLGWSYETQTWRLGALFQGARDDPSFFGLEGAWIPLEGASSPYFGGGLGVVNSTDDNGGEGKLGGKLDVGAEFFRLHTVRLLVGGTVVIPFSPDPGSQGIHPELWLRLGL